MNEITAAPRPPFRPAIRRARKDVERLERRLKSAHEAGDKKKAAFLQAQLLTSRTAKIAGAFYANRKAKCPQRMAHRMLLPFADQLDATSVPEEDVFIRAKRRERKKPRIYWIYGLQNSARQQMVSRAMKPLIQTDSRQHLLKGRDEAVKAVTRHINDGYRYVMEADIQDFYPSIDPDRLKALLPVTDTVADTVILSASHSPAYKGRESLIDYCPVSCSILACRGLPQGNATAPLAGEIIVGDIMKRIAGDARIVNYGDNFFILGRTPEEVRKLFKTLQAAIAAACGRSSTLIVKKGPRRVCYGFDCLGYHIKATRRDVKVSASKTNRAKFQMKLFKLLALKRPQVADREAIRLIKSWKGSFSQWPERSFYLVIILGKLAQLPDMIGPKLKKFSDDEFRIAMDWLAKQKVDCSRVTNCTS